MMRMSLISLFRSYNSYLVVAKICPMAIFFLMVFGGYVKAIGAGLACPDWPLCHGQLIPTSYVNASFFWVAVEYFHRIMAFSAFMLILVLLYQSYCNMKGPDGKRQIGQRRFTLVLLIATLF